MKKKYMLMGIAAMLIATTVIGGTWAALNTKSEKAAVANISLKSVGVTIVKEKGAVLSDGTEEMPEKIVPGSEVFMPRAVKNHISDGYDVYVKVTVYHTWETKNPLSADTEQADVVYVDDNQAEKNLCELYLNSPQKQTVNVNGWILAYADDEQIVMYYSKPLAPNEVTTDFISGVKFLPTMGNDFADAVYQLEYEVTAVQANHAEDAIAAELGVFPSFDENGNITAIAETR